MSIAIRRNVRCAGAALMAAVVAAALCLNAAMPAHADDKQKELENKKNELQSELDQIRQQCLANNSLICHNTHLVVTVRIIFCDHTRISCRSIGVCILAQRIRVESVRSIVLDCFRRSDRFDNLCAGSTKSSTDQAFFQSKLIHQCTPSFICDIFYTLHICQGHSILN